MDPLSKGDLVRSITPDLPRAAPKGSLGVILEVHPCPLAMEYMVRFFRKPEYTAHLYADELELVDGD